MEPLKTLVPHDLHALGAPHRPSHSKIRDSLPFLKTTHAYKHIQVYIKHANAACMHKYTMIDLTEKIIVLKPGRILEYDTPAKLLEREDSAFSKLITEYSVRSQSFNNLADSQTTSTIR